MPETSTDSYLSVFLSSAYAQADELSVLSLLFLFLSRILPIIGLSPFFGSRVLPNPVKMMFGVGLFIIMLPKLLTVSSTPVDFNLNLVFLAIKELFIGFLIGMIISIPFTIVQASGMLIDHQRGGASLMVNDPTIQNQSSPVGTVFNMVMIYIFYVINGPFIFLEAISHSYDAIPPDKFLSMGFFSQHSLFWEDAIKLFNDVMVISIQLCTPALIAILMTDVFLGIANRLAPQVQITFLGMPLKSLLGLGIVCIGWNLLTGAFAKQGYYWLDMVSKMISYFKPA